MDSYKILVTNDDGVHSPGLRILYNAVKDLGKVYVVAPETPKSASGLGITLHKPIRLERYRLWEDVEVFTTNGTPSDIVYLALNGIASDFDLAVSGVNIGDNTSIQVILSSGTVGAAAQAALVGIKAIAFSAAVDEPDQLVGDYAVRIQEVSRLIAEWVLSKGLPEGVDILNVNYPPPDKWSGRVEIATPARLRYLKRVAINYDPRGRRYYWLYGKSIEPEEGTDVYSLFIKGAITLTPLSLNLSPEGSVYKKAVEDLLELAESIYAKVG